MITSALLEQPILPPSDIEELDALRRMLEAPSGHAILRGFDGREMPIPHEIYEVLLNVVGAMRSGKAITVAPVNLLLTTQEAAEYLGISRPSVVKLLTDREIPYEQPGQGRHRKVRLSDLVDYQQRRRVERSTRVATLIRRAAEDGLYSEALPADYLKTISSIRKSRSK